MYAELIDLLSQIQQKRDVASEPEDQQQLTNEEILVIELARNDWQDLINKCRYSVIQKLIADGWVVEVWLPFQAHYDDPLIRPAWEVAVAHQSTNRI